MFDAGCVQVSLIDVGEISVAVSKVGELGTILSSGLELDVGVATASDDGVLGPTMFIEETR